METYIFDILFICKGRYNRFKYATTFSALKMYLLKLTDNEDITDYHVLSFLIHEVADKLLDKDDYKNILVNKIINSYIDVTDMKLTAKTIAELYINQLDLKRCNKWFEYLKDIEYDIRDEII